MAGPLDNAISFPHGRPHTLCLRSSEDPCLDLPSFFTFACRSKWQKNIDRWWQFVETAKVVSGGQYNQLTSLGLHYLPHSFDTAGLQRVPVQWKQTWGRAFFPHVWSCSSACWATSRERAEVELRSAKCGVTKQPAIRQTHILTLSSTYLNEQRCFRSAQKMVENATKSNRTYKLLHRDYRVESGVLDTKFFST